MPPPDAALPLWTLASLVQVVLLVVVTAALVRLFGPRRDRGQAPPERPARRTPVGTRTARPLRPVPSRR